jgi:UDPglucose 6-dehydrogenase
MTGTNTIGFAGLSHLGIIYSAAAAVRGFSVLGFDERPGLADDLSRARFPVAEPGLAEAARESADKLRYTAQADELAQCQLIFVTLDVSTNESNTSDLAPLEALLDRVISVASDGAVVAIMSQVPPGFCRKLALKLRPALKLYYQIETLVFGNAVERAVRPERYMVGCADPKEPFPLCYSRFLDAFDCPVLSMRYESAELCKIAINCFLVSSVSTTNTLAEICENIGADWSEIAPALKLDRRIGPHAYLKPGLGIAGGNLERDLVTLQRIGAEYGCDTRVVSAWQQNSAYARDWVLRRLFRLSLLRDPGVAALAVWGLTYKPDTHSTKNSPSLELLRSLPAYCWRAYDPMVKTGLDNFPQAHLCGSAVEAIEGADALVVMTPWTEFASAPLNAVLNAMKGRVILDPYAALDGTECLRLGFEYHRLGA